jgi:hypothetical protein
VIAGDRERGRELARAAGPLVGAAIPAAALGIAMGFTTGLPPGVGAPLASCLVLAAVAAPLARRVIKGRFDLLEPIVPAALMLGLLFGVRPLVMLATGDLTYLGAYNVGAFLDRATGLGLLGSLAFVLGYEIVSHRPLDRHAEAGADRAVDEARLRRFIVVCSGLGLALFAVHLSLGGSIVETLRLLAAGRSNRVHELLSSSSEYLSAAPVLLACAATVLVAARAPRIPRRDIVLAGLLAAVPIVVFFAIGTRRFILPSLVLPVLVFFLISGKRPRARWALFVLPALFVVLATIPVARSAGAREQAGGLVPIFQEAARQPQSSLVDFVTGLDTSMVPALAMEIEALDRTGHFARGGATVGDFFLAPVPSALFDKPQTARNQMLIDVTGRPCETGAGGSCPDFSVVGTFYQDLGYLGVGLGMVLFGAVAALAWRRHLARPHDASAVVLAGCTALFAPIAIRAGLVPPAAWFLYFLIPTVIGVRLALGQPQTGAGRR